MWQLVWAEEKKTLCNPNSWNEFTQKQASLNMDRPMVILNLVSNVSLNSAQFKGIKQCEK